MIENTSLFQTDSFLSDNRRQIGDGGFSRIFIIPYIVDFPSNPISDDFVQ